MVVVIDRWSLAQVDCTYDRYIVLMPFKLSNQFFCFVLSTENRRKHFEMKEDNREANFVGVSSS